MYMTAAKLFLPFLIFSFWTSLNFSLSFFIHNINVLKNGFLFPLFSNCLFVDQSGNWNISEKKEKTWWNSSINSLKPWKKFSELFS